MARKNRASKSQDGKNTALGCLILLILFSIFTLVSESTTSQAKITTLAFWSFVTLSYFRNSKKKAAELIILSPPVTQKDWERIREIFSHYEPWHRQLSSRLAKQINSVVYTNALQAKDLTKAHQALQEYKSEIQGIKDKVEHNVRELLELLHIPIPNNDFKSITAIRYSNNQIILQAANSRKEFPVITRDSESREAFIKVIETISSMLDLATADYFNKISKAPDFDSMTGSEFELYVVEILKNQGYIANISGKSGDLGVDILAEKDGLRYAIQCKRQANLVSRRAVSDAVAGMSHYECDQAMVITNNYFSPGAKQLAKTNNCILIDRKQLVEYIKQLHNGQTI